MRTATIKVYKVDELSEKAKEKAFNDFCCTSDYFSASENESTLKEFENLFPIKVKQWEYGFQGSYINYEFTDDEIEELSGIRLLKYLYNNYWTDLFKGKYYSKGRYIDGKYTYKSRRSKAIFEHCCVLTGYCIDDDILDPIYNFLKKPEAHITFNDLMDDCLQSWIKACENDYEAYFSMESFEDMAQANEWEFKENGEMF
jgi:hypothetical protein